MAHLERGSQQGTFQRFLLYIPDHLLGWLELFSDKNLWGDEFFLLTANCFGSGRIFMCHGSKLRNAVCTTCKRLKQTNISIYLAVAPRVSLAMCLSFDSLCIICLPITFNYVPWLLLHRFLQRHAIHMSIPPGMCCLEDGEGWWFCVWRHRFGGRFRYEFPRRLGSMRLEGPRGWELSYSCFGKWKN